MPRSKYQVISVLFDIKPVTETGEVNLEKLVGVESVVNLGRKLRIGKFGPRFASRKSQGASATAQGFGGASQSTLKTARTRITNQELRIKKKESEKDNLGDFDPRPKINNSSGVDSANDLEKYLNEDIDPAIELTAIGGEILENVDAKPRYRPVLSGKKQVVSSEEENDSESNHLILTADYKEPVEEEKFEDIISQINQKVRTTDDSMLVGEPKRVDVVDWWQENSKYKTQNVKPKTERLRIKVPRLTINPSRFRRFAGIGLALMLVGLFAEYSFSLKNEIVHSGNSAVSNLESAGENIKKLDFTAASSNFSQAYADFSEAGNSLNFMGATLSSLIADLPGGSKLKSAKNLVEAGKLMADAGQAMTGAMNELAKTGLILNPTESNASIGDISKNLRGALAFSQKNIKEAKELLVKVDAGSLPEDKRGSFEEFRAKLPEFDKLVADAVDYSKFLEDFIGTKGTQKYLLLFQNPAELRPTGGFPGSYGVIVFKDGKLQDFRVDDIYNIDGQLKELYVPPLELQHIVPNWAMRDTNWFVDFPMSAGKITEFYKKESGQDVDGVITFSPRIVSEILKITGPIRMDKYGVTLNFDNFSQIIQEEVEYKADRAQPKKILVDLAPLMLEKIYSADSDSWMRIFDVLVSSVDGKDILMYFRDLKLQDFSVTKGFSGRVNQAPDDYLMLTLTNIKGSKTDDVIDSQMKVDTIFEGNDVRHRVILTRTHNGGNMKYGFYNKQSPSYVRILVPDNAQFLGISGNSKTNFKPLLDYPKTDFKRDEDLVRFEEKSFYDSEAGITVYEEAGKREYGFWMVLNPGETKRIELEYRVPGKASGNEYEFYVQKQPGLELTKFDLDLFTGTTVITQSSLELNKGDGRYTFSGKLDRDLPVKVIFR